MEQPKVVLSEADKAYLKSYVSKGNHSAKPCGVPACSAAGARR